MGLNSEIVVTDRVLWTGTLFLLAIAMPLFAVVARLVPRARFAAARSALPFAAFVVWSSIWLAVVTRYWEAVYGHFFPSWSRWGLPLAFGLFYAAWSCLLATIARRAAVSPALVFVLLGALLGPATHLLAVERGLLVKAPLLRGASPLAAIVISAPEFAIYWCVILLLAAATERTAHPLLARRDARRAGEPDCGAEPLPVLLFDGTCHLCAWSVRFVLAHEAAPRLRFAPLDSPAARRLLLQHDLAAPEIETVVVVEGGEAVLRSEAVLRIVRTLRWPWRLLGILRLVPRGVRDRGYDFVARRRVRWFGRLESCLSPTPELAERFLRE